MYLRNVEEDLEAGGTEEREAIRICATPSLLKKVRPASELTFLTYLGAPRLLNLKTRSCDSSKKQLNFTFTAFARTTSQYRNLPRASSMSRCARRRGRSRFYQSHVG